MRSNSRFSAELLAGNYYLEKFYVVNLVCEKICDVFVHYTVIFAVIKISFKNF